jgi:hypothetical protein
VGVRRLLGFNEDVRRPVWGLERFERDRDLGAFEIIVEASGYPDLDGRNRDRVALDDAGGPRRLRDGRLMPVDPGTLNMGPLLGLASQAHAHYQLAADRPSDDVEILRADPRNFVVAAGFPGPVETQAAAMAQLHLDLASLAVAWGEQEMGPCAEYLALTWLGAGLHYLQDASGGLHAVQIGSYAIFRRARLLRIGRALVTFGGLFGELPSFVSIGLDLLSNHHLLGERWLAEQVLAVIEGRPAHPAVARALADLHGGKEARALRRDLRQRIAPWLAGPGKPSPWEDGRGPGRVLTEAVARQAADEGGGLLDALFAASGPGLKSPEARLEEEGHLDASHWGAPEDPEVQAALARIGEIQARSLVRAAVASSLYVEAWLEGDWESARRRLRRSRLLALAASDARRARYVAAPPPPAPKSEVLPLWAGLQLGVLVAVLGGGLVLLRRHRGRRQRVVGADPAAPAGPAPD